MVAAPRANCPPSAAGLRSLQRNGHVCRNGSLFPIRNPRSRTTRTSCASTRTTMWTFCERSILTMLRACKRSRSNVLPPADRPDCLVNVGEDSPVFDGLFDYIRSYCSGSIGGACRLNEGLSDVVINWSGGLHHAKKSPNLWKETVMTRLVV